MFEDEFDPGYDGFGRDDDYNIWEENQLALDREADEGRHWEDEFEDEPRPGREEEDL